MGKMCVFDNNLCFDVCSDLETFRVETILDKEPETIAWIDRWASERHGAVFFDVGANIGVYSLYAAYKSPSSSVFAIEPVSSNYVALQKNVLLNGMDNVHPFNIALSATSALVSLYLNDLRIGNSGAQIDKPVNERGETYAPQRVEKVLSISVDGLVSDFGFPNPNFVKIDVDGHEPDILSGMSVTLASSNLRSVLIEFNNVDQFSLWEHRLSNFGLSLDHSFDNLPNHSGKRRQAKASLARNYIFTRRA